MTELETIHKPLAPRKQEETKVNFNNPEHYPEELNKDLFSYLRTPLPDGLTVPLIKLPVKQQQSKYWFEKLNVVGAMIALSTLGLLGILLQETDFLNVLWQNILRLL